MTVSFARLRGWMRLDAAIVLFLAAAPLSAFGQAIGLPEISEASKECIECHKNESRALYQQ